MSNKSLLPLIAAKQIKHVTFVVYTPFSGYVTKEVSSIYEISEGRISINGEGMQMTVLAAQCEIIATLDRQVEVKIEGHRDTLFLSW